MMLDCYCVMFSVQGEPNGDVCFSALFTGGYEQCHRENNAIL